MKTKTILGIAAIIALLIAGYALARPSGDFWNNIMGYGNGMMGSGGMMGYGNGMMGSGGMMGYGNGMMGSGGMMGYGNGMMGSFCTGNSGNSDATSTTITIEQARDSVLKYLQPNPDLSLSEIIEFDNHFYAAIKETGSDMYAFELLVNRYNGDVMPEMGPNMMWNTKYGHMNLNSEVSTAISRESAIKKAQDYLDTVLPGTAASDADAFYGYYTIELLKGGKIAGMLSVNSNTGAVWYHGWHGDFIRVLEID